MAVATVDVLLSSSTYLSIELVSVSRKRTDCFKITISASVYYTETWQRHADIFPIPLDSIIEWTTDPETLYTKQFITELVWGEDTVHDVIYSLLTDIQTDITGYMKERWIIANSTAPLNLLNAQVAFDPDQEF